MIGYAAGASVAYGFSDFANGYAGRRAPAVWVMAVSRLPVFTVLVLLAPGTGVDRNSDLLLGMVAGVFGYAGMVLLYQAFATGAMATAGTLISTLAAGVPVVAGLLFGVGLNLFGVFGLVATVVAILLLSREPEETNERSRAALYAVLSGACLGAFTVLLSRTSADSGLWPLVGAQTVMLIAGVLVAAATLTRMPTGPAAWFLPLLAACFELGADVLTLLAVRANLTVAGPILALSPAVIIVLARLIEGERVSRTRRTGIGYGFVAVILLSGSA